MSWLYVLDLDSSRINFYIFYTTKKNVAVHPSMWGSLSNTRQQPEQQEITQESPTPGWQKHIDLSFMSLGLKLQLRCKSFFPEPGFINVLVVLDVPSRGQ